MQIKVVPLPSDPPSSPSPDQSDPPIPLVDYSLRFQHFLLILIIVFLVFISCDYIWRKLIVKFNDNPFATTTTNTATATSSPSSSPVRITSSTDHHRGDSSSTGLGNINATSVATTSLGNINHATSQLTRQSIYIVPPRPRPPPLNVGGSAVTAAAPNRCSECVICLKEFRYFDLCRVLPDCNHTFHAACIDGWISINRTCPICRSSINPTF